MMVAEKVSLPSYQEFKDEISYYYAEMHNLDSHSDFHWMLARVQEWVKRWPPILDENGGL